MATFVLTNLLASCSATRWNGNNMYFSEHDVSVGCFNVTACKIIYDNSYLIDHDESYAFPKLEPGASVPKPNSGHISIANFPPPAVATWTSEDGESHTESIDIGAIFTDQRIRHTAPPELLARDRPSGTPIIYMVINDRTVSVYMIASVYLTKREHPDDKYSHVRYEPILAYSRRY